MFFQRPSWWPFGRPHRQDRLPKTQDEDLLDEQEGLEDSETFEDSLGNTPSPFQSLLKKGRAPSRKADLERELTQHLYEALLERDTDRVALLLDQGAPLIPDERTKNPLLIASELGLLEALKHLTPRYKNLTDPFFFGRQPKPQITRSFGRGPLLLAARRGHLDCVQWLESEGWDVDALDQHRANAIMYAAGRGHVEMVEYLFSRSKLDQIDLFGFSFLMHAAHGGSVRCVKLALSVCDAKHVDSDGRTALMTAASFGHLDAVDALLPYSDIDAQDTLGWNVETLALNGSMGPLIVEKIQTFRDVRAEKQLLTDFLDTIPLSTTMPVSEPLPDESGTAKDGDSESSSSDSSSSGQSGKISGTRSRSLRL